MPITPTYPGVYIEEIPSGVRTITGVSTSVTAFVGPAKRGPTDQAVNILSYADFERRYGGLLAASDMTYAVRQFFLNGGSNAWVIRVAINAHAASHTFQDGGNQDVLLITALDAGSSGNDITVQISYPDARTFNLTFFYKASDNPSDTRVEKFSSLSMDPNDPRYVESMVNGVSQLVTVTVQPAAQGVADYTVVRPAETLTHGTLTSSIFVLADLDNLPSSTKDNLQISLDGYPPDTISRFHFQRKSSLEGSYRIKVRDVGITTMIFGGREGWLVWVAE